MDNNLWKDDEELLDEEIEMRKNCFEDYLNTLLALRSKVEILYDFPMDELDKEKCYKEIDDLLDSKTKDLQNILKKYSINEDYIKQARIIFREFATNSASLYQRKLHITYDEAKQIEDYIENNPEVSEEILNDARKLYKEIESNSASFYQRKLHLTWDEACFVQDTIKKEFNL